MKTIKRKGFTLVELLVTISIIAILTTVSVVGYVSFIDKTNDTKAVTELTQIRDWAISYDLTDGNRNGKVDEADVLASLANANAEVTWGYNTKNNERVVRYAVGKRYAYWTLSTGNISNECDFVEGDAPVIPTHECESKCATCGKCLNKSCNEAACAEKCLGHVLAHEHVLSNEWETVTPATCLASGVEQKKCTLDGCSYAETQDIPSLGGHDEVTHEAKDPTCTEIGWDAYVTCSRCDYSTKVEIPSTGHRTSAATCTEAGTCTVCGAELAAAQGHDYKEVVTEPTCETGGYTTHTCSRCGDSYVDNEITALGHDAKILEGTEATCLTPGQTEGKECTRCGATLVSQEVIEALGHNITSYNKKDATCTEAGHNAYEKCSRCDYTTYVEIPATGHKMGEGASCTEAGTCTVCGEELAAAQGHDYKEVVTAPTCTADGYTTYTCSRCGDTYTGNETDALGHNEETINAIAPTCTATGLTEGKRCTVCNTVTVAQTVVDALGHTEVTVAGTVATCTVAGLTDGTKCSVCGITLTAQETIPALDHKYTNYVSNNNATCSADGTKTATCDNGCGTKDTQTDTGTKLVHSYTTYVSDNNATCTADGTKTATCDHGCGTKKTVADTGSALGHDYASVVTAPTCTAGGYTTYTCSRGDHTYKGNETAALGHNYQSTVTAPTCEAGGYTTYKCSRCDDSYTDNETAALGHKYTTYISDNNATCTADGTKTATCDNGCGTKDTITDTGTVLGHNYTSVVTAPTCDANGYTTHTCSRCNNSYTDSATTALGHKYVNGVCSACGAEKIAPMSFADKTYRTEYSESKQVFKQNGVTFTQTDAGNVPIFGGGGEIDDTCPVKLETYQKVVLSCDTAIKKVVIYCNDAAMAKSLYEEYASSNGVTVEYTEGNTFVVYTAGNTTTESFTVVTTGNTLDNWQSSIIITNIEVYQYYTTP